jgi:hypothetical protein
MSALHPHTASNDSAADPAHQLEKLVKRMMPCMSRIVGYSVKLPILGTYEQRLSAFCEPIGKLYVMTSLGFAKGVRFRGGLTKLPKLLSHLGYSRIDVRDIQDSIKKLEVLLATHNNTFPKYAV